MLIEKGYRFKSAGHGCEQIYEKDNIEVRLNRCKGEVAAFRDGRQIAHRYFTQASFKQDLEKFLNEINHAS